MISDPSQIPAFLWVGMAILVGAPFVAIVAILWSKEQKRMDSLTEEEKTEEWKESQW